MAKHWPLAAALTVLYLAVAACWMISLKRNEGRLVYALDDAYIHMAIAKNIATHGVWGVTRHGFSSASSSILWPALIALAYLAFGVNVITPLLLNILAATGLVVAGYVLLSRQGFPARWCFVGLLALTLCAPLPFLVITGLEHSLHISLAVLFFFLAARFVAEEKPAGQSTFAVQGMLCVVLAVLLAATRFEGLFMIAAACGLLLIRRRVRDAVVLGGFGVLPVVVYGLVSLSRGWYFLPNSVWLKGRRPSFGSFSGIVDSLGNTAYKAMFAQPEMTVIVVGALVVLVLLYRKDSRDWPKKGPGLICRNGPEGASHKLNLVPFSAWSVDKAMMWLLVTTTLLHLQFARTGGFFRYEAYLVACAILGIPAVVYGQFIKDSRPKKGPSLICPNDPASRKLNLVPFLAVGLIGLIALLPFGRRCAASLMLAPRATHNIYEQQYRMASFLQQYYSGRAVAANDIGAISYYADIDLLDLAGLADMDVARARLDGTYGAELIGSLAKARGVKIAVIHDRWFSEHVGLPPAWRKVGQWEISDNAVCADSIVSFFAVNPAEKDALSKHLAEYSARGTYYPRLSAIETR